MTYPDQIAKRKLKVLEAIEKNVSPYMLLANAMIDVINRDYGQAIDTIEISRELSKEKLTGKDLQHFRLIAQGINELTIIKIKEYETIPKIKK